MIKNSRLILRYNNREKIRQRCLTRKKKKITTGFTPKAAVLKLRVPTIDMVPTLIKSFWANIKVIALTEKPN